MTTALRFNLLLQEAEIKPSDVRLLRHQTLLSDGRTPLELWRADRAAFDAYQAHQLHAQRTSFARSWWASFLGMRDGRTMFVGLYEAGPPLCIEENRLLPGTDHMMPAGSHDLYPLTRSDRLAPYIGRLYIEWGGGSSGKRAWKQRAEAQDKVITELHLDMSEQPFPGLLDLAEPLSRLAEAPPSWIAQLAGARGIYLLTCSITGALYVGSATGAQGFWGRWMSYAADGHGGNVALMSRPRSDWIVSILQVAGSADTNDDILAMEVLWKRKLRSRELGLNRN